MNMCSEGDGGISAVANMIQWLSSKRRATALIPDEDTQGSNWVSVDALMSQWYPAKCTEPPLCKCQLVQ